MEKTRFRFQLCVGLAVVLPWLLAGCQGPVDIMVASPPTSPAPAMRPPATSPTQLPGDPLAARTPVPDASYGPNDYVVLLTVAGGEERHLAYLSPAGSVENLFPSEVGTAYNTFSAPTQAGRLVGEDMYGPGGLVVVDFAAEQVAKRALPPGRSAFYAQISPDGRWIAFLESDLGNLGSGRWRLATWEIETGNAFTITQSVEGEGGPLPAFWSPATGKIYWRLGLPATGACPRGLWGADPQGRETEEFVDGRGGGCADRLSLSPGGTSLAYRTYDASLGETLAADEMGPGRNEIRLLDLQEGSERVLWQGDTQCEVGLDGWLTDEVLVADQICPARDSMTAEVIALNLAGEKIASLWSGRRSVPWLQVLVSPNGSWLLVEGNASWSVVNVQTGEKRVVHYPEYARQMVWCEGGDSLVYNTGCEDLQRLDLATGESTLLWEGQGFDYIGIIACR